MKNAWMECGLLLYYGIMYVGAGLSGLVLVLVSIDSFCTWLMKSVMQVEFNLNISNLRWLFHVLILLFSCFHL